MRKRLLVLLPIVILLSIVVGTIEAATLIQRDETPPPLRLTSPPASPGEVNTGDIEAVVNQVRVQNGLVALTNNSLLTESAMARAKYLCENNIWSHDGWVGSLTYPFYKAGENLEYGSIAQTPRTIVDRWVNSPAHYANMTDPVFTEQGMGLTYCKSYQGQNDVLIVVNHFGRPR